MAQKPNKEPFRYRFSVGEYLRALLELDGTGSTLGSYEVTIEPMPNKILKFTVKNKTGWESGTRLPFVPYDTSSIEDFLRGKAKNYPSREQKIKYPVTLLPKSILSDKERSDSGPGGDFTQTYIWYEKQP